VGISISKREEARIEERKEGKNNQRERKSKIRK